MTIQLMQGDCLELMKDLSDKSIDFILCDLPYGVPDPHLHQLRRRGAGQLHG